jgi:hypothetical protein
MATRVIVTSQPDVACYVCERRLLRGEQHEVFLAAGQRRTVCELCAPRAAYEGWLRESDEHPLAEAPLRPRRGRNLFGRLRLNARAAPAPQPQAGTIAGRDQEPEPYDFLSAGQAAAPGSTSTPAAGEPSGESVDGEARGAEDRLQRALDVFNAGEYPRRVASLARSLGAPEVSVRLDEDLRDLVEIVVAWELCWYRYRADVDEEAPGLSAIEQGTDLEELPRADLLANALVDEFGKLSLSAARA